RSSPLVSRSVSRILLASVIVSTPEQDRLRVFLLRRRNDHRSDVGMFDDLLVAAAVEVGTRLLRKRPRARWSAIGPRQEPHRRMLCREPRAQRPDAARADNGDAEIGSLHYATCRTGRS